MGVVVAEHRGRIPTFADVNRDVGRTLGPPGDLYFAWMSVLGLLLAAGILAWTYQIWAGMGTAGKRTPQMWAMYITSFVFWIGIGHAGTLISAILYLFRARWRTSIFRAAEAMTIFAVMTAGLFPLIHLGRMWFFYYLLPYPNQRDLWPNFKSPLVWDVFALRGIRSAQTAVALRRGSGRRSDRRVPVGSGGDGLLDAPRPSGRGDLLRGDLPCGGARVLPRGRGRAGEHHQRRLVRP